MMKSHSVPNEFLEKPWLYMPSYVRRTGRCETFIMPVLGEP